MFSQFEKFLLSHLQFCDGFLPCSFWTLPLFICWAISLKFYQCTLALNTDFLSENGAGIHNDRVNSSWKARLEQNPIAGEDHMFMATTNYTWNSFKHLWSHLFLSSTTISKINGNNPGNGSSVLFLERIPQCPHKQGHLGKHYLRIILRVWLNYPLI